MICAANQRQGLGGLFVIAPSLVLGVTTVYFVLYGRSHQGPGIYRYILYILYICLIQQVRTYYTSILRIQVKFLTLDKYYHVRGRADFAANTHYEKEKFGRTKCRETRCNILEQNQSTIVY